MHPNPSAICEVYLRKHIIIMKNFLLFLALLPLLGCNKQDDTVPSPETFDYFIFGTAAGKCTGNCVTLFKLEGQNLYADDDANYLMITQDVPFQTTSLPAKKVALAETLQAQFPANLLEEPDGNVGCPDCYDQGLFYVKIKAGDTVREWRIDRAVEKYTAYCDLISTTLEQLK